MPPAPCAAAGGAAISERTDRVDSVAQCRGCRLHPAMGDVWLLCWQCRDSFRDTEEAITLYGARLAQQGALPHSWGTNLVYIYRQPADFGPEHRRPGWQGWEWEGLGTADEPHPPHVPVMPDTSGRPVAVWEARIFPPRSALRLHIRWRPTTEVEFRREISIRGAGEGPRLTRADREQVWQALDILDDVLNKGGAPKGPRPLTAEQRAQLNEVRRLMDSEDISFREATRRQMVPESTVRSWMAREHIA